jgi:hypothetical protein
MIIKFSQSHFEHVSIYQVESLTHPTTYVLLNKLNEDLTFVFQYKAGKLLSAPGTTLIAPHSLASISMPRGSHIYLSCGRTHERTPKRLVTISLKSSDLKQVNAPDFYECVRQFQTSILPASAICTARVYKRSYIKTKQGKKAYDCEIHRIMMAGGVDLFFIHNKNHQELLVRLDDETVLVQPDKVTHISSSVDSFCVKFLYLRNPTYKRDRQILETDKFKYLESYEYTNKDTFIKEELWKILRK